MLSDRSVKVRVKGDLSDLNRALLGSAATAKAFTKELDTSTDRMQNMVQTSLALGPALIPLSAAAIPAVAGLTNQLAFAGVAAGVTALAFQGVGDALKATNDYAIEPSAANFDKMQRALDALGPAGRNFVNTLQELRPQLQELQDAAQAGLFPGAEDGLTDLMDLLPQAEQLVTTVATTIGDLIAEAGDNLNDPRWREFFTFLNSEARPTLLAMGRSAGNFAEGLANLWMAFAPLSNDFSSSFLELSRDFAKWTDGLDQTEGFQEFIDYIQTNGPEVWETLGSVGNGILQIVEAAAPVGADVLPVIKLLADTVATLADSDLGPVAIGLISITSAYSRLIALGRTANSSALSNLFGKSALGGGLSNIRGVTAASNELRAARAKLADNPGMQQLSVYKSNLEGVAGAEKSLAQATRDRNRQFRAAATGVAATAFVMSDLDDKMGLSNTAMFAMTGSLIGPWGTAVGAGVGLAKDFASANDSVTDAIAKANAVLGDSGSSYAQQISAIDMAIAKIDEYKKKADDGNILKGAGLDGAKNVVEGIFGKSDTEENAAARDRLVEQRKAATRAAQDQKFAEAGLSGAMAFASNATRDETLALLDNIKAKNEAADSAENAFGAETSYRQALKAAQEQAKNNKAGIDGSSDAALKNRDALDTLATSWNRVADAGDATSGDMRKARSNFIRVAESMGVSKAAARALAQELFHLPSPHPRVVLEGVAGAVEKLQHVKDRLLDLDGTTARTFVQIKESVGRADGGLMRPAGLIHGPGGPRDDLIDAKLSNREFVVNAAATNKYLPELYAMNALRFASGGYVQEGPRVQRFADGGPTVSVAAGSAAPGGLLAPGARFKLVGPNLLELVDNRVEARMQGEGRWGRGHNSQNRGRG
jgi:hypothetical protein